MNAKKWFAIIAAAAGVVAAGVITSHKLNHG
jgi:hypothetical protein